MTFLFNSGARRTQFDEMESERGEAFSFFGSGTKAEHVDDMVDTLDDEEFDKMFEDSVILKTIQMKKELNKFYPFSEFEWDKIYQASKDGFEPDSFHKLSDEKSNVCVFFQTTNHSIFGGYTPLCFSSNYTAKKYDDNSFLFSLSNKGEKDQRPMKFTNNGVKKYSIGVGKWLSTVVFGLEDVYVVDAEISTEKLGESYVPDREIPKEKLKSLMFGRAKTTLKEIEIFQRGERIEYSSGSSEGEFDD